MPGDDLSIQARLHRSGLWIVVPITIGPLPDLAMVLDSGSPVSAISPETAAALSTLGLLAPAQRPRYQHRLTSLTVQGQQLPDLEVRILSRLSRLQVVGLLGLDFLSQFKAVHYYVETRRLILEIRSSSGAS